MNMRKSNSNQNRSKNALWDKYKDTILLKIRHDIVHDAVRRLHVAFKRRTADVKKGKFKKAAVVLVMEGLDVLYAWSMKLRKRSPLYAKCIDTIKSRTDRCYTLNWHSEFMYEAPDRYNILLEKYKAIYFFVPKVASTSLKKLCIDVINIGVEKRAHFHRTHFPSIDRKAVSKGDGYFKFAFVRNPYDRLVSCYFGKVVQRRDFASGDFWKDKSFEDFVKIICKMSNSEMDIHFRPQYTFLTDTNGKLLVDFIGRFENINEDFGKIKERAYFSKELELPHLAKTKHEEYQKYYTEETKRLVAQKYKKDLELFHYSF